jgi:hypothetical protein
VLRRFPRDFLQLDLEKLEIDPAEVKIEDFGAELNEIEVEVNGKKLRWIGLSWGRKR